MPGEPRGEATRRAQEMLARQRLERRGQEALMVAVSRPCTLTAKEVENPVDLLGRVEMYAVFAEAVRFDLPEHARGGVEQPGVLGKDGSAQVKIDMSRMGLGGKGVQSAIRPLQLDRPDGAGRPGDELERRCASMGEEIVERGQRGAGRNRRAHCIQVLIHLLRPPFVVPPAARL